MSQPLGHCQLRLERDDFLLNVSFDIPAVGMLGLFGVSGSGKTTALRCVAGLEKQVAGHIEVDGENWLSENGRQMPAHQRRLGYVFQDSRLFPHLDVTRNLMFGAKRRLNQSDDLYRQEVIDLLGLNGLLSRMPGELSGGEKQRVAIARALLSDPKLLLMDEPLASLDEERKSEILPFLERLHREVKIPILYVSHSVEEMQLLCDRVIILEHGQKTYEGTMVDALTAEDTPFARQRNASSLFRATVAGYEPADGVSRVGLKGGDTFLLPAQLESDSEVMLRVLATDVSLSRVRPEQSTVLNVLPCEIVRVVTSTPHHITLLLHLSAEEPLLARISLKSYRELALHPSDKVFAMVKAVSIHGV